MWCTRWFLPLLLLPLPTAPVYFLVLFLFSLTLHAKPCFYCVVLITTLFVSSCYWQPMSLHTPLAVPWADNITTYADALSSMLAPNFTQPLPAMIHPVDRCWCDLTSGNFFEPFNISNWEYKSVVRLKNELERSSANASTADSPSPPFWLNHIKLPVFGNLGTSRQAQSQPPSPVPDSKPRSSEPTDSFSWLHHDIDLRPYGLDLIVDFSW